MPRKKRPARGDVPSPADAPSTPEDDAALHEAVQYVASEPGSVVIDWQRLSYGRGSVVEAAPGTLDDHPHFATH